MKKFDIDENILKWGSEEVVVPYRSPIDGKIHRYFVDFYIKYINNEGQIEESLIEVKPYKQCKAPKKRKKVTRKYITEVKTWGINSAKWKAAQKFCDNRGWKFAIWNEKVIKFG
jgi:hypothetical protein